MVKKNNRIKEPVGDRIGTILIDLFLALCALACLYPVLLVFSLSISDPIKVFTKQVYFLPNGFSLEAYKYMLFQPLLWTQYGNTLFYTFAGTLLNVTLTTLTAYALSRPKFCLRNSISLFMAFTMFFSGGLVPTFIIFTKYLGLYNSRWALIVIGAVSAYNTIIARTFFQSIPEDLHESATLDGAGEMKIFLKIYLPLCMPIIAVLILYYGVAHWNSYLDALLFLPDASKQPVQMYLRRIVGGSLDNGQLNEAEALNEQLMKLQLRYVAIVVIMTPILCLYPFLQKYFVKGMMIGAIKS